MKYNPDSNLPEPPEDTLEADYIIRFSPDAVDTYSRILRELEGLSAEVTLTDGSTRDVEMRGAVSGTVLALSWSEDEAQGVGDVVEFDPETVHSIQIY